MSAGTCTPGNPIGSGRSPAAVVVHRLLGRTRGAGWGRTPVFTTRGTDSSGSARGPRGGGTTTTTVAGLGRESIQARHGAVPIG
ncbi:hypothetical protein HYQ46_000874 [Verticillium longisporum]|nr:hypothetical protein HYQ46_000874 [Verticillium longisporum]